MRKKNIFKMDFLSVSFLVIAITLVIVGVTDFISLSRFAETSAGNEAKGIAISVANNIDGDKFKEVIAKNEFPRNLLMYAVMRFGKSFTSMCCAKEINSKLVVVVSAKADVKLEWKKTVESHVDFSEYVFLTSDDLENLAQIQWDEDVTIGSSKTSFTEFYQDLLVTISSNVENNSFKLESQDAIVSSLTSTYNNLTKVDSDEEMINLLQYQAAYEANAKVITAVDEMLQTLLNM